MEGNMTGILILLYAETFLLWTFLPLHAKLMMGAGMTARLWGWL